MSKRSIHNNINNLTNALNQSSLNESPKNMQEAILKFEYTEKERSNSSKLTNGLTDYELKFLLIIHRRINKNSFNNSKLQTLKNKYIGLRNLFRISQFNGNINIKYNNKNLKLNWNTLDFLLFYFLYSENINEITNNINSNTDLKLINIYIYFVFSIDIYKLVKENNLIDFNSTNFNNIYLRAYQDFFSNSNSNRNNPIKKEEFMYFLKENLTHNKKNSYLKNLHNKFFESNKSKKRRV
jgi:hypothetical protein